MKSHILAAILAFVATTSAHDHNLHRRHAKRQAIPTTSSSQTLPVRPTSSTPGVAPTPGAPAPAASTPPAAGAPAAATAPPPPNATGGIPPLSMITLGMPTQASLPVTATFAAGAKPTYAGAPALPKPCKTKIISKAYSNLIRLYSVVFDPEIWPAQDRVPPTGNLSTI